MRSTNEEKPMSTLQNRPNVALLVVDVQEAVVADAHQRAAVVTTIADLVEKARTQRVPVVWVRHHDDELVEGTAGWQIVGELAPNDNEPIVEKTFRDAFEDTRLEAVLAERGVGKLFVAGAETDFCVRSTLHGALVRGYDVVLVSDAHTTNDHTAWGAPPPAAVVAHTNLYWSGQNAPGRTAGTVTAADTDFTSR